MECLHGATCEHGIIKEAQKAAGSYSVEVPSQRLSFRSLKSTLRKPKLPTKEEMVEYIIEQKTQHLAEQLRDSLSKNAKRVADLFRDWDDDQSGTVSRAEFHKAIKEMQFSVPKEVIDDVFSAWDPDNSGALEVGELEQLLRKG